MDLSKIPRHIWWGVVLPLILVGLGLWRLWPVLGEYRGADECKALETLCLIAKAEHAFLGKDGDMNGVNDFWTGDVGGVFQRGPKLWRPPFIRADAAPWKPQGFKPVPFQGYYFVALKRDKSSKPAVDYQEDTDKSGRKVHHLSRFGFCAYPARYDWRHRLTFIINEDSVGYSIDNGGKPLTEWPLKGELAEHFTAWISTIGDIWLSR